ncbi:MAG: PASTA domain-containing protein, partial [Oscillospiraceae bacterium]|nr:PASTA domain-containing protein [Oscillospiraceae bacterium]
SLGMESVSTEQDSKRYYPQNDMAAQVIGFTNTDGNGQYGLEYYYNDYLSGVNGRSVSAKDAQGNSMPYRHSSIYPAQDGASIYLTLDTTLQYCLEKNLKEMSDTYEVANRSCGIIMNAKTGAVYAMATYPSFDLNDPSAISDPKVEAQLKALPEDEYQEAYINAREKQWKNKAISEVYVPGSVFKIFTASAAIEEKAVDWETYGYYCSGEYRISGAEPIHCHNRNGHGTLSFQGALTQSCNPAFIDIGRKLGIHKFCTYFSSFGLTEKTGIDLPGETSSIYREEEDMNFVDLATSSFGQCNVLTPMEMITGIAASVNGGYLVQPHVVDRIVSSDGNVVKTFGTNVRRQVISEETSKVMRRLLQGVVDDKSGANAHIDGYKIGGKSGTGQSVVNGRVSEEAYVASYTCFAPADDPEIIMLVMADTPNPSIGYYGSYVAAPCARSIMEEALPYLGFYPEYTEEQAARLNVNIPLLLDKNVTDAKMTLDELKLNCRIIGEGETVVSQCPATGSSVSAGGSVVLYTDKSKPEKVEVPDLKGYTASDANEKLANLGLNYISVGASADDSGVLVEHQSIEAGMEVEIGTVVTLTYLVNSQSG